MSRSRRRDGSVGWLVVKLVVAAGLLAFVIATHRGQIRDVWERGVDGRLFALAFGFYMAGVLLAFLRWYTLVRAQGLPFRLRDAYRLGFIGLLFNLVIPGAIGGDLVKAAYLCGEQGKRTGPIASVVVDRIVGLLGLFLLASLAGTAAWGGLQGSVRELVSWAWGFTVGTSVVLAFAFLPTRRRRTSRMGTELAAVGQSYRSHFGVIPLGTAMGAVTHTFNVLAFWVLGLALFPGAVPGLKEHLLIVPLVLFSTAVPLPLGALGLSEQVSDHLFGLTGYDGGAVAMMTFRLLQLGGAIVGGLVYLANHAQVRALRARAEQLDEGLSAVAEADGPPEIRPNPARRSDRRAEPSSTRTP